MLSMYKLKDAVQRGAAFLGAAGMLAGIASSALPALASADALNPLTERSLTLSSSSPGWSYLDGSGNTTYAYPNSGANGQKTGNTFQFRVSSTATVKAVTFQYCTQPAGTCIAPGDNDTAAGTGTIDLDDASTTVQGNGTNFDPEVVTGSVIITAGGNVYTVASRTDDDTLVLATTPTEDETGVTYTVRGVDSSDSSDLNVNYPSMSLISDAGGPSDWDNISAGNDADPEFTPESDGTEGEFVVLTRDAAITGTGTISLTNGSNALSGVAASTAFTSQLAVGAQITIGGNTYVVANITDDDTATLTTNALATVSGAYIYTIPGPADTYTSATDWAVTSSNSENGIATSRTNKKNFITMTSATGIALGTTDYVKVIFYGTTDNYITNPGSGAFFVRMNTYSDNLLLDDDHLIDGGVTVANVMNESITIQTKVLETMAFSVGTYDPYLYLNDDLEALSLPGHGQCSALLMKDPDSPTFATDTNNVLRLGTALNDYSLSDTTAHAVQSYWRLSSNSSSGATVYYTGHTLTNTVGDEIAPLDDDDSYDSQPGSEQFGLAIAHNTDTTTLGFETYPVWLDAGESYGDEDDGDASDPGANWDFSSFIYDRYTDAGGDEPSDVDEIVHYPRLWPLVPMAPYDNGAGDTYTGTITSGGDAEFAFNSTADTHAVPIATENTEVVNCVTAKMRYIANIAATTPAGVYTTKINYVASPQY